MVEFSLQNLFYDDRNVCPTMLTYGEEMQVPMVVVKTEIQMFLAALRTEDRILDRSLEERYLTLKR